jgi:hypothetical protein
LRTLSKARLLTEAPTVVFEAAVPTGKPVAESRLSDLISPVLQPTYNRLRAASSAKLVTVQPLMLIAVLVLLASLIGSPLPSSFIAHMPQEPEL